jgi:A/G-specific adenine glycosylase
MSDDSSKGAVVAGVPSMLDAGQRAELRRALLDHYDRSARALPWRGERDPYRVLVSEVMLQQTRVETVRRFYGTWLERFPDVDALAAAGQDEVLKAWEGLGYYRRARNLQGAAQLVRERLGGAFPTDADGLRALPGVGEYTAGAVASIAFGKVAAAVDGNVRRVLSRLFDVALPGAAWLRETAAALVDRERPGDWNQALMDLGATVCTPRAPGCDRCPVAAWCRARSAGTVPDRPARSAKRVVPTVHLALGVFHEEDRVLLERRLPDGLLGGMWAFPEAEVVAGEAPNAAASSLRARATELGVEAEGDGVALDPVEHRFTHLRAIYLPWAIPARPASASVESGAAQREDRMWATPARADELALPVAQRRVLDAWRRSCIVEGW